MPWHDRGLTQDELRSIQALFDRTVEAERDLRTEEQRAEPRRYLRDLWLECAAIVTAEIPGQYGKLGRVLVPPVPAERNPTVAAQLAEEENLPF